MMLKLRSVTNNTSKRLLCFQWPWYFRQGWYQDVPGIRSQLDFDVGSWTSRARTHYPRTSRIWTGSVTCLPLGTAPSKMQLCHRTIASVICIIQGRFGAEFRTFGTISPNRYRPQYNSTRGTSRGCAGSGAATELAPDSGDAAAGQREFPKFMRQHVPYCRWGGRCTARGGCSSGVATWHNEVNSWTKRTLIRPSTRRGWARRKKSN